VSTDKIEKRVILKASRERVWQAISDSARFGAWFGVAFAGPFVAGAEIVGRIEPTQVDAEVAKLQEPMRGMRFVILVDRIEPMTLFSFRWRPFAIDPDHDYSAAPTTLVEFRLSEAEGGVLLTITESGFDALPPARREQAFEADKAGWEHQARLIAEYLTRDARS